LAGSGRKWLIGCGVGCGTLILLAILLTVGGGIIMTRPFSKAVNSQKALNEEFGTRDDFVPPAVGLSADRLEAFLQVRRELEPFCAQFEDIAAKFQAMEEFDDAAEDPPTGEILKRVGSVMGAVFGIAGKIGNFTEARNEALLAQEMSLGEYVWIYTLAYYSWLEYTPGTDFDDADSGEMGRAQKRTIRLLMESHAEALAAAGDPAGAEAWREESARMKRSEEAVPFSGDRLPAGIIAALKPYRYELEELYCPSLASFEFSQIRKKGWSFHSN
jgi:hypothetical protein